VLTLDRANKPFSAARHARIEPLNQLSKQQVLAPQRLQVRPAFCTIRNMLFESVDLSRLCNTVHHIGRQFPITFTLCIHGLVSPVIRSCSCLRAIRNL